MKWSQYGRLTLALVASLALGLSMTACNPSFTLGFVYILNTAGTAGTISAYTIDSVSGAHNTDGEFALPIGRRISDCRFGQQ